MAITAQEIAETRGMVVEQHLDIRTATMGVSLLGCADENIDRMATKVYDRITSRAERLVPVANDLAREYGIPIVNKRVSVTPIGMIASACSDEDLTPLAQALDRAAQTIGIDFIGGFSALVHKGIGDADRRLMNSIPTALATTERVCSSVNVASLRAGINMDAVLKMAEIVKKTAEATADNQCYGAAKLVVFSNMVEDSPFMAGAVHGTGEADAVINVGVSGPGVMAAALERLPETADFTEVAEEIKKTSFKITRAGELVNIDGAANRVSALAFGVKNVIYVVGINKICPTLEDALDRASNVAAPLNAKRLNKRTPCAVTGKCSKCNSPDCICNVTAITHHPTKYQSNVYVIVVGENLGY